MLVANTGNQISWLESGKAQWMVMSYQRSVRWPSARRRLSYFSSFEVWLSFSSRDLLRSSWSFQAWSVCCRSIHSSPQKWKQPNHWEKAEARWEVPGNGGPCPLPPILRGCHQSTCQLCSLGLVKSLLWPHSSPLANMREMTENNKADEH